MVDFSTVVQNVLAGAFTKKAFDSLPPEALRSLVGAGVGGLAGAAMPAGGSGKRRALQALAGAGVGAAGGYALPQILDAGRDLTGLNQDNSAYGLRRMTRLFEDNQFPDPLSGVLSPGPADSHLSPADKEWVSRPEVHNNLKRLGENALGGSVQGPAREKALDFLRTMRRQAW